MSPDPRTPIPTGETGSATGRSAGDDLKSRTATTSLPFDDFYREQQPRVLRLCIALCGNREVAEELTQEAFTRVMARYGSLTNPAGYVRTAVVNLARSGHRRSIARHARRHLLYTDAGLGGTPRELLDTLAALPYRQRAVLVLRYWADWSEHEIADALGIRTGTVKSLASRSLDRLRHELKDAR